MQAAIYARISNDKAGAGLGVASQEQDCRDMAASLGWEIVAVHTDNDISAYSGKRRPGYQALLDDMRAGRIGAVLAWHTDRLHRSLGELETYVSLSEQHGVTTQTVKAGHIDLATPSGRLVARQLGAVARYEVEHAIERMQRAKARTAQAGLFKGGRRPYGYEADGVTVVPDEAAAIRDAAARLMAGESVNSLCREWNAAGRLTSMGNAWHRNAFRVTMLRPRNAGLMVHQGRIIGEAGWPAIIPEQEWRALVDFLEAPGRRTAPGVKRWLGTGLYLCSGCGTGVICGTSNGVPAYRCREPECGSKVVRRQSTIDPFVEAVVCARLEDPSVRAGLNPAPDCSGLEEEAVSLRSRLDSLAELFAAGSIDARQLSSGSVVIGDRLAVVQGQIAASYNGTALAGVAGAESPGEAWLRLPLARKRAVLAAVTTVTLLPSDKGRPAGWTPGQPYFRPDSIRFDWH